MFSVSNKLIFVVIALYIGLPYFKKANFDRKFSIDLLKISMVDDHEEKNIVFIYDMITA